MCDIYKISKLTIGNIYMQSHKGFSLAETLVSLLILSVILAAAMPVMTLRKTGTSSSLSGTGYWKANNQNIYNTNSGNVGIGTSSAQDFLLTVGTPSATTDQSVVFYGNYGVTSGTPYGAGTRFEWLPGYSAIRAGTVTGTQWDSTNIANYSTVLGGYNGVANATYSATIGGLNNVASGQSSSVIGGGYGNATADFSSIVGGDNNTVLKNNAVVVGGENNSVNTWYSAIVGGSDNTISVDGTGGHAILGGYYNLISSSGWANAIIGGTNNVISSGNNNVIVGGYANTIGSGYSDDVIIAAHSGSGCTISQSSSLLVCSTKFYYTGSAPASGTSDIRLKNIHGAYNKGLNAIIKLKPVKFKYKNKLKMDYKTLHYGMIAQDVQKAFPEAIMPSIYKGYLTYSMEDINLAMINAIKELNDKNIKLEKENAELKTQMADLDKRISVIENQKGIIPYKENNIDKMFKWIKIKIAMIINLFLFKTT